MKKNVLYLGNNLSNSKTNVSYMKGLAAALEQEGFNVVCASSYTNKLRRLLDMVKATIKYGYRMDIVLIDTYSTQNFYYAVVVSQICRILQLPYMPILHGGNLPQRLKDNPKLSAAIFKHAKHLVSPSLYLSAAFETYGYKNVIHIPNALNLEQYQYKERSISNIRLLWVRSFSKIYHPKLAVDILKQLRDAGHNAELCMVGPDTDGSMAVVKAYAKQFGVHVRFTGKLTKPEWTTLAQGYNIFINTTNFDNMPVSVIEAMALGLPIVSTNVGGMPYLIDDAIDGLLVPPNDADAFVAAILRLKQDEALAHTLAKQARCKVEGFDWKVVKALWEQVLG